VSNFAGTTLASFVIKVEDQYGQHRHHRQLRGHDGHCHRQRLAVRQHHRQRDQWRRDLQRPVDPDGRPALAAGHRHQPNASTSPTFQISPATAAKVHSPRSRAT